jgi:hypothetical protein
MLTALARKSATPAGCWEAHPDGIIDDFSFSGQAAPIRAEGLDRTYPW